MGAGLQEEEGCRESWLMDTKTLDRRRCAFADRLRSFASRENQKRSPSHLHVTRFRGPWPLSYDRPSTSYALNNRRAACILTESFIERNHH
jgi:hypothetical protein